MPFSTPSWTRLRPRTLPDIRRQHGALRRHRCASPLIDAHFFWRTRCLAAPKEPPKHLSSDQNGLSPSAGTAYPTIGTRPEGPFSKRRRPEFSRSLVSPKGVPDLAKGALLLRRRRNNYFFSTHRLSAFLLVNMSLFAGRDRTRFGVVPSSAFRPQSASPLLVEKERIENEDILDTADPIDLESQSLACRAEGAHRQQETPAVATGA